MKLSILLPVFNEKNTILKILKMIQKLDLSPVVMRSENSQYTRCKDSLMEIIVVDDGSTDGTREILKNLSSKEIEGINYQNIKVIFQPKNYGKGMAIRRALTEATGDIIIIQDADLEYDPNDYPRLIKPILDGRAEVVYGNRWHRGNRDISYRRYLWGGRLLTLLANILYHAQIKDEPTCYKVFKAEVIKGINLECEGFEFCPEVTAKVRRLGYKIYELPIAYHPRGFEEGKKINWRDGVKAIWLLVKYRFINIRSVRVKCASNRHNLRPSTRCDS